MILRRNIVGMASVTPTWLAWHSDVILSAEICVRALGKLCEVHPKFRYKIIPLLHLY